MSTPEHHDEIETLAVDYVLGTVDEAIRVAVEARRQREPDLDQAIATWEECLMPLALSAKSVEPPPELFSKIMQRIDVLAGETANRTVLQLKHKLQQWRRFAVGVSALAASLLIYIGFQSFKPTQPDQLVAVLQQSDTSPAFLVAVDLKSRELTIRSVAAPTQQGKSYELWIVNDKLGAPRSLGVVDSQGVSVHRALARYDAMVVRNSLYAISLEPEGGSPTGHATGPILYTGKLLELAQ